MNLSSSRRTYIQALAATAVLGLTGMAIAGPPKVVSISPASGSIDVDPATTAVVVKFDQDMGKGMSWTGGGPHFPETSKNEKATGWVDSRTCVLGVVLKPGKVYRLGLNSSGFHNFQNAAGEPLVPQTLAFATKGAKPDEIAQMKPPKAVQLNPANGATGVDPGTTELSVAFDQPMAEGMSWTGGGENFPEFTGKPRWDSTGKTCTAPVKLKPNHSYDLGINSVSFQNFQNRLGVPAGPLVYRFETGPQK
jgi:hypothetical protein